MTETILELASMDRVTVLAPYRRDAEYLSRLLREHAIDVDVASSPEMLARYLECLPGALVAAHEGLTPDVVKTIGQYLREQPSWSELPIIVLFDRSVSGVLLRQELGQMFPASRLLFYQRPVMPMELVSGVQSALLARIRQRQVRDHIDREIELRRELNHRVKNILASVISIFEMTSRRADSIGDLRVKFEGRLHALSKVHSAAFTHDGASVSLGQVTDLIFKPYNSDGHIRVRANGPSLHLATSHATTLALCLHELATNAMKYGALSSDAGEISFEWGLSDGARRQFWMSWIERGGPAIRVPQQAGYGTRYLTMGLTAVLGEKPQLFFAPDGFRLHATGDPDRLIRTAEPPK